MQAMIQHPLVHVMTNSPGRGIQNSLSDNTVTPASFMARLQLLMGSGEATDEHASIPLTGPLAISYLNMTKEAMPDETLQLGDTNISEQWAMLQHYLIHMINELNMLDVDQEIANIQSPLIGLSQHVVGLEDSDFLLSRLDGLQNNSMNGSNDGWIGAERWTSILEQTAHVLAHVKQFATAAALAPASINDEQSQLLRNELKPLMLSLLQTMDKLLVQQSEHFVSQREHMSMPLQMGKGDVLFKQVYAKLDAIVSQLQLQAPSQSTEMADLGLLRQQLATNEASFLLHRDSHHATFHHDKIIHERAVGGEQSLLNYAIPEAHAGRLMAAEQATKPIPPQAQYLAEQLEPHLIKQLRIAQVNGLSEARISLIPEHLGHLNIQISLKNGQMVAQFIADNIIGKEMLEGQLSHLRSMLQGQGIQVERLEVIHSDQFELLQQPKEQYAAKDQKQQQRNKKHSYDVINDEYSLDIDDDHLQHSRLYGSSFEAVI